MRPLRNPVIQSALAWCLARWMRFCYATIRWEHRNQELAEAVWRQGGGALVVFWHSRTSLAPYSWPLDRAPPVKGVISRSVDGEFVAKAVAQLGIPAVRGSSSNKDKADRGLAITPDGPRGPVRSMAEGLPLMAKLSKAPVLFIGLSCNPAIRLNSWDRSLLPLPFGKGAVIWDRADFPEGGDLAEVAADWRERTTALEAEADALTGLERV